MPIILESSFGFAGETNIFLAEMLLGEYFHYDISAIDCNLLFTVEYYAISSDSWINVTGPLEILGSSGTITDRFIVPAVKMSSSPLRRKFRFTFERSDGLHSPDSGFIFNCYI